MRILHVITSLDPDRGGPPAVVTRLAAAQAALGHPTTIASYALPEPASERRELLPSGIPHANDVKLEMFPAPRGFERITASQARRRLAKLIASADVLHLHGVWDPILLAAAGVARSRRVPYVVAPHGMLDPWSLRQRSWKKQLALRLGYGRMLRSAAFIHTLNADEARLLEPADLRNKTQIIPNGVFLEELDPLPAPDTFHRMRPELQGRPYVLFLSRLHYKKGLDLLAEAFAQVVRDPAHPELALVVAGPDGGARESFERQVHDLGIANRVHLVGPLYGQDKLAALAGASCFCLPSRQEGFSMAITEALACGVPVVISESCHFPEVAEVGAGEIVALSAVACAEGIKRVLGDVHRRKLMGQAGRELVASRYAWNTIARRSIEAYVAAMASKPAEAVEA